MNNYCSRKNKSKFRSLSRIFDLYVEYWRQLVNACSTIFGSVSDLVQSNYILRPISLNRKKEVYYLTITSRNHLKVHSCGTKQQRRIGPVSRNTNQILTIKSQLHGWNFITSSRNYEYMKRLSLLLFSFFVFSLTKAQSLKHVVFSAGADLTWLSFITDQKIIIKISPDGKVLEYGNELEPGRFYSQPGRLQQYMGRVEFYEKQFDTILNGKLKSIGTTSLMYYGSTENASLVGKVKSIGTMWLDYYTDFENEAVRGKLKSAGQKNFNYFTSFENEAYRGKIKTLGNNQITYYSTFDDKSIRGKLKSIGSYNYTWYTSLDRQGFQGTLKTGSQYQLIEGVTYIIW